MSEQKTEPTEYAIMERKDEQQIIAELSGKEFLQEYVYSFKQGNREITNLSYIGIKEAVRERGHFSIADWKIEETGDAIFAVVKVHDKIADVDALGTSEAKKDQPFARVLALNKAERNAYAKLLPAKLFAEMIKRKLGEGKVVNVKVQAAEQEEEAPLFYRVQADLPERLNAFLTLEETDQAVIVHVKQRLETEDWKQVCDIAKKFGGDWDRAGGTWVIPQKNKEA